MDFSARRFLSRSATLLAYILISLSSLSFLVLAQEPPFEIHLLPQAESAVAGQPFTYTVVITNVSEESQQNVLVRVQTPSGTTFADTHYTNVNWGIRGFRRGEPGEILWFTQAPVASSEVITFDLIVNVLPEFDQELINEGYNVAIGSIDNIVTSGPSIKTPVLAPTPVSSATIETTDPPTPVAISSPTSISQVDASSAAATPTRSARPSPAAQADAAVVSTITPPVEAISQSQAAETSAWPIMAFVIVGLTLLVIAAIGLTRVLKQ